ncbi:hypothetical protein ILYODFUR_016312 [Ilyodon furcidens]|uniref:Uncharacterized protein n=1 Tax=Ilyodon furcidens TaxID=33524 RepID=A0ABV0V734_9TELE
MEQIHAWMSHNFRQPDKNKTEIIILEKHHAVTTTPGLRHYHKKQPSNNSGRGSEASILQYSYKDTREGETMMCDCGDTEQAIIRIYVCKSHVVSFRWLI